jgi:NADPH:quinone reductase-like Zn-dependent oxidoreductase
VARSRGADELIDYGEESIRDRVRALTGGKGADVVYGPVGGDAFDQALRAVGWEARMLIIGFAAGRIQAVPAYLILVKNISVIGVVWGAQADITSSNFPRRARNTNSGHPILANDGDADIRTANNVIHHVEGTPSFLELPVVR